MTANFCRDWVLPGVDGAEVAEDYAARMDVWMATI